jgi:hypothetical protein
MELNPGAWLVLIVVFSAGGTLGMLVMAAMCAASEADDRE